MFHSIVFLLTVSGLACCSPNAEFSLSVHGETVAVEVSGKQALKQSMLLNGKPGNGCFKFKSKLPVTARDVMFIETAQEGAVKVTTTYAKDRERFTFPEGTAADSPLLVVPLARGHLETVAIEANDDNSSRPEFTVWIDAGSAVFSGNARAVLSPGLKVSTVDFKQAPAAVHVTFMQNAFPGDVNTLAIRAGSGNSDARCSINYGKTTDKNKLPPDSYFLEYITSKTGRPLDLSIFNIKNSNSLSICVLPSAGFDTLVPASLSSLLAAGPDVWQSNKAGLFYWIQNPQVRIFKTDSYQTQREFFIRPGFYYCVDEAKGRVFDIDWYKNKHSYNAHDYKASDLADFYMQAVEEDRSLTAMEQRLYDILNEAGILQRQYEGVISAGTQTAVLSFSAESPPTLAKRLLAHELFHGIFYASKEYREGCFELYNSRSSEEKFYWKTFLGAKGFLDGRRGYYGYAVDDPYVLVNEMQAHLMQLSSDIITTYFIDIYARRLISSFPEHKKRLLHVFDHNGKDFIRLREKIEVLLETSTGIPVQSIYTQLQ